jgi:hypothetical protein
LKAADLTASAESAPNLQAPFNITKTGPSKVQPNVPFLFDVVVTVLGLAKGVRIVDDLPPGLFPAGNANWTATPSNGSAPGGGECVRAASCAAS